MIVTTEHALCTAQHLRPVKETARMVRTANFINHRLPNNAKVILHFAAAFFIKRVGFFIFLQRHMKKRQRRYGMAFLLRQTFHLFFIPCHLIIVNIIIRIQSLSCISVRIQQKQRLIQTSIPISDFNHLIVSPCDIRLNIWIQQILCTPVRHGLI